ncbi:alpha/beta fold hydrolase [Agromyces lapidis]|uniref:Alpha/beta fold hydrolase n=1 Tax=Agromyces lapidis TaxID=279574 RepID=A0ABV5SSP4_9MICO|nr:alpha/beta hydrolase [Agromyces lapidis]
MTSEEQNPTIFLIPGHWLGAWAWDDVVEHLRAAGHRATGLTLPGLDPEDAQRSSRTLDEQADAIEQALAQDAATGERSAVIVAHSGANAPVSMVLDRHPELVRRMVWVDSGPLAPGSVFAPDATAEIDELPLPPFEALAEQASLDGLSPDDLERFRRRAVPEPGPVLRQAVALSDDERLEVPTTLVCCSISSGQIRELAAAGHPMFAEVGRLTQVEFVDLPTGHWPMWSRPADLAQVIASAALVQ